VERFIEEWRNMNSKHFSIQIILRLILASSGMFGIIYYSYIELNYIRIFFIGVFILIVLIELFYYLNRANKDTSNFLQSIIHNDFTLKYSADNKGDSFNELYNTFNKVNQKFIEASQSEATEYHYLNTLIQQVKVGILSFDEKGRIGLANNTIKSLLGKNELINILSIKKINEPLYEAIERLNGGDSEVLKIELHNSVYQLSINVSEFKLRERSYKLISIQDIRGELDENEMAAWQKLIRVLTHEIMNSVAPITSLSGTLNEIVSDSQTSKTPLNAVQLASLHQGLDAIENRSAGLMNFTEAYRSLTRVPLPNIKAVDGKLYFQRIKSLFIATLTDIKINFKLNLPKSDFELHIDPDLMEQVFINLLKNAKESIIENGIDQGEIALIVDKSNNSMITISDNGGGIPAEVLENIFIPFYTTKDSGSGVGLSLGNTAIKISL
jgi:nitrogen fixation/metabolism regulation signal transduction histidine kinase